MISEEWTEEEIEASRQELGLPQDWQWFSCEACGSLTWVPPDAGDLPLNIVCSMECLLRQITGKSQPDS